VAGTVPSGKQERTAPTSGRRAEGRTWVEIAVEFRARCRVNARVAFRPAHGWRQVEVAEEWNRLWPDDLTTFETISYRELWPGSTGHARPAGTSQAGTALPVQHR
jgi:hypothetical protein